MFGISKYFIFLPMTTIGRLKAIRLFTGILTAICLFFISAAPSAIEKSSNEYVFKNFA